MSGETELAALRAARDAARADLSAKLAVAKTLVQPSELKRRIGLDIDQTFRSLTWQAIEIAGDNRGVVAGTVSAVLMWLGRKQIIAGALKLGQRLRGNDAEQTTTSLVDRAKTVACNGWHQALSVGKAVLDRIRPDKS